MRITSDLICKSSVVGRCILILMTRLAYLKYRESRQRAVIAQQNLSHAGGWHGILCHEAPHTLNQNCWAATQRRDNCVQHTACKEDWLTCARLHFGPWT